MEEGVSDVSTADCSFVRDYKSGTDMFGFSNPEVSKLIQVCSMTIFFLFLSF